ncbi:hypothetical protein OSB04_019034 [Centaurea solstitialis]|uniref:Uncharacterized protein n=1 Tax=Centaurea solstitialis TaxID=347529 RepID=A0AA38T122_9ASTR|nr:hypothetical protein OSB04_019034 [Centaurea solstitialis]
MAMDVNSIPIQRLPYTQWSSKRLGCGFEVDVAGDHRVWVGEALDGYTIDIHGHCFPVSLYPIDWLVKVGATIVYREKLVRIPLDDGSELVVYGYRREGNSCVISLARARRSLIKGCVGYLAHVIDAKKEMSGIKDIPVVREYTEVFPDDLSGLPPDTESI